MEFSKAGFGVTMLCASVDGSREGSSQGPGGARGMPPSKYRGAVAQAFTIYSATACVVSSSAKMGLVIALTSVKAVMRIKGLSTCTTGPGT